MSILEHACTSIWTCIEIVSQEPVAAYILTMLNRYVSKLPEMGYFVITTTKTKNPKNLLQNVFYFAFALK